MEDALPSLAELSLAEAKYQSISLTAGPEGEFGVTLRYFSIQPANASVSVCVCVCVCYER